MVKLLFIFARNNYFYAMKLKTTKLKTIIWCWLLQPDYNNFN